MDLKSLFNILLLALSLATILITLVSFLLYKLRQVTVKGQHVDPNRTNGVFFVRYSPQLEKENQEARQGVEKTQAKKRFSVSLGALFVIVVSVIATSLLAEIYYVELQARKSKIAIVENYRKLVDEGLLKRYDYMPSFDHKRIRSWKNFNHQTHYDQTISQVKSTKIFLATTKYKTTQGLTSNKRWGNFLKRQNIPYNKGGVLDAKVDDLIILPYAEIMTRPEKNKLEALLSQGASLVFTGPVGYFNGLKQKTQSKWSKEHLGLAFNECLETEDFPSIFALDKPPWWHLYPGTQIQISSAKNEYCAYAVDNLDNIVAYEANYDGVIRYLGSSKTKPIVKSFFKTTKKGRIFWLAFDPEFSVSEEEYIKYVHDDIFFSAIRWAAKKPSIKLAVWPEGKKLAIGYSSGFSKDNESLDNHLQFFNENSIPLTLFVKKNNLDFLRTTLQETSVDNLDYSVALDMVKIPGHDSSTSISRFDFDEIERARLDIEEQTAQVVRGIRISKTEYSSSTLYSTLQNRLTYVLADDYKHGVSVLSYNDRPLVWIPNYSPFGGEFGRKRLPASVVLTKEHLLKTLSHDENLERFIVINSDNISSTNIDVLKGSIETLSGFKWIGLNLKQAHKWVLDTGNLSTSISESKVSPGLYKILITNEGENKVENLTFYLDIPKDRNLEISSYANVKRVSLTKNNLITIPSMPPNSSAEIIIAPSEGL